MDLGQVHPGSPSVTSAKPLHLLSRVEEDKEVLCQKEMCVKGIGKAFKKVELASLSNDIGCG